MTSVAPRLIKLGSHASSIPLDIPLGNHTGASEHSLEPRFLGVVPQAQLTSPSISVMDCNISSAIQKEMECHVCCVGNKCGQEWTHEVTLMTDLSSGSIQFNANLITGDVWCRPFQWSVTSLGQIILFLFPRPSADQAESPVLGFISLCHPH